jgi:uncharacterized protein (DUF58 family)
MLMAISVSLGACILAILAPSVAVAVLWLGAASSLALNLLCISLLLSLTPTIDVTRPPPVKVSAKASDEVLKLHHMLGAAKDSVREHRAGA